MTFSSLFIIAALLRVSTAQVYSSIFQGIMLVQGFYALNIIALLSSYLIIKTSYNIKLTYKPLHAINKELLFIIL